MAFIFVPNADGSFTEGDKQTNPDTGVEYIYIDGAWRALGPKIQDEFDTLDGRYVKLEETSILGDYYRLRGPNAAGTGFNSFVTITDGEQKLYNIALAEDSNTGWAASVQYVQNYVQTAVGDVDLSEYLPLTGGTMTGDLNMESADIEMLNSRIDFYNSSGDRTMEIAASGFIKSRDMLRVVRTDGGPILEGRTSDSSSDIKVKIDSDGYFQFRDRGELYGDIYLKGNKRYIVQGAANTNVAQFYARTDNIARIENSVSGKTIEIKGVADPVDNRDAINLQYLQGLPYATEDYVDTATEHDLTDEGTQDLEPNNWVVKQKNQDGNNRTFISIYDGEMHLYNVADPSDGNDAWAANKGYVDNVVADYLPLAGGNLTGDVESTGQFVLDHGTGNTASKKLHIIGETSEGTNQDLFWSYKNSDGTEDAVNYKGKMTNDFNLVNKGYVDSAVASGGGGVPVGCIMIWMNSSPPAGWFKLQGSSFNINTYPQLHAYLQSTAGYVSGTLPNWSGHYPGEYGDHMANNLGTKVEARTGQPAGGAPRSSNEIPNGATRTFGATGNTNAYSAGKAKVSINENWDNTTRPKTVVVHYIIKHD